MDKLKESSNNLRIEMEEMLTKHKKELENLEISQNKKITELKELKENISNLKSGKRELLSQIKMLSDVNEEWEEKYKLLNNEYNIYKQEENKK